MIAQGFHWLIAALIFVQFAIGFYASELPVSLARLQWISWHKSLGATIFVLVLMRLAWRLLDPPPRLPPTMPRLERVAARVTHYLLYALLLAAPLAGWMHASAAGLSVNWFGLVSLPDFVSRDTELAQAFRALHSILVATLAVLIAGHVAAALRHAFLLRDGVMQRMLPWRKR